LFSGLDGVKKAKPLFALSAGYCGYSLGMAVRQSHDMGRGGQPLGAPSSVDVRPVN